MVYPRRPLAGTKLQHHADDILAESGSPKRRKRRKLAVNHPKPSNTAETLLITRPGTESRCQAGTNDLGSSPGTVIAAPVTPITTHHKGSPETPEIFTFKNKKAYQRARTLFSMGYSSSSSADSREDQDIPSTLRWNELMSLLASEPISCSILPMKGTAQKIVRPARNGVIYGSVTLHKPHGGNPKVEREMLENMAGQLMQGFRWRKDHFVMTPTPTKVQEEPNPGRE
ncbi:uncharacterized protein AB675_6236 [Cyphellophora attinorum]|uniref:Uncharacterized protein n=1 Tax=Cyphellophora attinorum TaxID=1664694 RepID=A0A0N1HVY7_9EURO|nr:uncharacterized protein AB675_6236 [Phialophora attinorum]KPI44156.1 hypothetical protein AB675_6236 [Phialophora attinorum]